MSNIIRETQQEKLLYLLGTYVNPNNNAQMISARHTGVTYEMPREHGRISLSVASST